MNPDLFHLAHDWGNTGEPLPRPIPSGPWETFLFKCSDLLYQHLGYWVYPNEIHNFFLAFFLAVGSVSTIIVVCLILGHWTGKRIQSEKKSQKSGKPASMNPDLLHLAHFGPVSNRSFPETIVDQLGILFGYVIPPATGPPPESVLGPWRTNRRRALLAAGRGIPHRDLRPVEDPAGRLWESRGLQKARDPETGRELKLLRRNPG